VLEPQSEDEEEESASEHEGEQEQQDSDGLNVSDEDEQEESETDDDSDSDGLVVPEVNPEDLEDYSPRQLELIQLASDLSANDDLLSCIFVDTFGSMSTKDDLGVYYHQGDFVKPYFDRKQVLEMAQQTIVQGDVQGAMDRCLRLQIIRDHIVKLKSNNQIKKFVAHLKRYIMLYHPTSRIEIRTTDRYRFATNKSELAVHSTVDLDPGLTEYVIMDIQSLNQNPEQQKSASSSQSKFNQPTLNGLPNALNGAIMSEELAHLGNNLSAEPRPPMLVLDEITGAMEIMPKVWEQRLSGNAVDDEDSLLNPVSAARQKKQTRNVPYGDMELDVNGGVGGAKKTAEIRDFSVVNSGRQGLMLFLGPGRFINHDCSPNVELITTKRNVITFRVLRRIKTGEELTTW
jgi:histone-lysine N-methyltransferase SUV420H